MQHLCPILDRDTTIQSTEFSRDSWQVVRCRETGFVFLANPPEYVRLEEDFAWEKTSVAERKRRAEAEPVFSQVSSLAKHAKKTLFPNRNKFYALLRHHIARNPDLDELTVLDIGCGCGWLLDDICRRLQPSGKKIVPLGIEISKALAEEAEKKFSRLGGSVYSASAVDGAAELDPGSVDVMIMSSFLEHEAQPLRLLRELRKALRVGGVILIKVPNFSCWNRLARGRRWCGFRYPDHVNYFTPRTLEVLSGEADLSVVRQKLVDKFPLSDNMYAVFGKAA